MRQARHKYLEDAALHEAELLQELDRFDKWPNLASCYTTYIKKSFHRIVAYFRERTVEMEKEIERQRLLELERAKTRELRYNLDMEKERQMQVLLGSC